MEQSSLFRRCPRRSWGVFGSLIYHAVEKYMMDPEILARMKPRGDAK